MTRSRATGFLIGLLIIGSGVNTYINLVNRAGLSRQTQRLGVAQHTLQVSQKQSTQTRVSTVEQRCQLTRLLVGVLVRHDLGDVTPFRVSLAKCLTQLQSVRQINARTPEPHR